MKKYIILLAVALLFGACEKDDDINSDATKIAERTVLIYMAADNNLYQFLMNDLREMKEGSKQLGNQQNLIIYVDQSNSNPTFIARIKDGVLVDSTALPERNTADPAVLEEMLRYTCENYPARSYGLGLWGHATGWLIRNDSIAYARNRAYGIDDGEKSRWMNIPSMARAIANGMGSDHLRFIFADCCNFVSIESAYELRHVTDYLIGSPAEIPDYGAPYHLNIPQLFNTSDNFYESVIDTYYDYYIELFKTDIRRYYLRNYGDLAGYSVPLAVIKSDELDNLAQATARLLSTIPDKLTPEGTFNLDSAMCYGLSQGSRYAYDICYALRKNTAESDFNNWKPAFLKAVPYRRFTQKWYVSQSTLGLITGMENSNVTADDCGEVSMFFPNTDYQRLTPNWNTAIQSLQWNNVIRWQQYGW